MTSVREHRGWSYWAGRTVLSGVLAAGIVLLPLIATTAAAQETTHTYSVLYTFTGGPDGSNPAAGLIRDRAGNFYGTTKAGGNTGSSCAFVLQWGGCGVVFKLDPAGTEKVLYTFTGGADGALPQAGLIRDEAGNFYGTTYSGPGLLGSGVVFKLDPGGNETVLHTFTGNPDGANPVAGLIRDSAANLFGTASGGGNGFGVVFKLDAAGNETVLHNFSDGPSPEAGLVRDRAGNLYGTTQFGGAYNGGVVFKLDPTGQHYRLLYTFTYGADGGAPVAGLTWDAAGNLYGTTFNGGNLSVCNGGCGVVFKLDPAGNETVLHTFTGIPDGQNPAAGLIRDRAGNLYGTTLYGGGGYGLVFKLDPTGKETVLYSFTGGTDGSNPVGGLILDRAGDLYGTTQFGGNTSTSCPFGSLGCGVVFRLH